MGKAGDASAEARAYLDVARARKEAQPVELEAPGIMGHDEARMALSGLIKALLERRIDPYTCQTIGSLLRVNAEITRVSDLEVRMAALERAIEATRGKRR